MTNGTIWTARWPFGCGPLRFQGTRGTTRVVPEQPETREREDGKREGEFQRVDGARGQVEISHRRRKLAGRDPASNLAAARVMTSVARA